MASVGARARSPELLSLGAAAALHERLLGPMFSQELSGMSLGSALAVAVVAGGALALLMALRAHARHALATCLAASLALLAAWPLFFALGPKLGAGPAALAPALALTLCVAAAAQLLDGARPRDVAAWLCGMAAGSALLPLLLGPLPAPRLLALSAALCWLAALAVAGGMPSGLRTRLALAGTLLCIAASWIAQPGTPEDGGSRALATARRLARDAAHDVEVERAHDGFAPGGRVQLHRLQLGRAELSLLTRGRAEEVVARPWDGRGRDADSPDREHAGSAVARLCTETPFGQAHYRDRARALVLGPSVPDVQCALYHGAARVTLAPGDRGLSAAFERDALRRTLGGQLARVEHRSGAARRVLAEARAAGFDLIALSPPPRTEQSAAGAYVLPEPRLHTVEALSAALEALSPGGVASIVLPSEREALRWAVTAIAVLRDAGRKRPEQHVGAFDNGSLYGVLVRREPFPMDELLSLHATLRPSVFRGLADGGARLLRQRMDRPSELAFAHGSAFDNRFGALFGYAGQGREADFVDGYAFELSPARDTRPDFTRATRLDRPDTFGGEAPTPLWALQALAAAWLSVVALIVLAGLRRRASSGARGEAWRMGAPLLGAAALAVGVGMSSHAGAPWLGERAGANCWSWSVALLGAGAAAALVERRPRVIGLSLVAAAIGIAMGALPHLSGTAAGGVALAGTGALGAGCGMLACGATRGSAVRAPDAACVALGLGLGALTAWALASLHGYGTLGAATAALAALAAVAHAMASAGALARE